MHLIKILSGNVNIPVIHMFISLIFCLCMLYYSSIFVLGWYWRDSHYLHLDWENYIFVESKAELREA